MYNLYHVVDEQGQKHGRLSLDTRLALDKGFLLRIWESEKAKEIYASVVIPKGDVNVMRFKRVRWAELSFTARDWFKKAELEDITLL